nr:lymphocyte antigen 6G6e-like [Kogia breviceps]
MGTSSIFLCILFLGGALGLATSPARRQLRCYTCNFAKPCYPVPTECQDDENSEVIEQKACLPRTQCFLQGHATYWSLSYTPQHHCCEQDLCNVATMLHRLPSLLLITPLILVASFTWGAHLLHQPSTQDSSTIAVALETPAQALLRSAKNLILYRDLTPLGPNTFMDPSPNPIPTGTALAPTCPEAPTRSPAS